MSKRDRYTLAAGAFLFLAATVFAAFGTAEAAEAWRLNDRCPAGFAPDAEDRCRLVSLYREYPSLQDRGMGGLKIGLPTVRDGFTAGPSNTYCKVHAQRPRASTFNNLCKGLGFR